MIFLVVASLLNIALDLFLIVVIPMGVAGGRLGHGDFPGHLRPGVPGVHLEKIPLAPHLPDDLVFRKDYARRLLGMGIPMGLQSSITAIGSILLQTSVNGLGSVVVASITAANKLYQLFSCVFDAPGRGHVHLWRAEHRRRPGDRIFAGCGPG